MLFRSMAYALGGFQRRAQFIGALSSPKPAGVESIDLASALVSMGAQAGDVFVGMIGTIPAGPTFATPGSQTPFPSPIYGANQSGAIFTGTLTEGHLTSFGVGGTTQSSPVALGVWRGVGSAVVVGSAFSGNLAMNVPYSKAESAAGAVSLAVLVTPNGPPEMADSGWTNRAGQQFGNWNHQIWDRLDLSGYAASQVNFAQAVGSGIAFSAAVVELRF